jgi:hypothetical protein
MRGLFLSSLRADPLHRIGRSPASGITAALHRQKRPAIGGLNFLSFIFF